MKLIIDISEGIYKHVDTIQNGSIGAKQIINSVKNGIPAYKAIPSAEPYNVLNKIKNELINRYPKNYAGELELGGSACHFSLNEIFEIIDDKYIAESEE